MSNEDCLEAMGTGGLGPAERGTVLDPHTGADGYGIWVNGEGGRGRGRGRGRATERRGESEGAYPTGPMQSGHAALIIKHAESVRQRRIYPGPSISTAVRVAAGHITARGWCSQTERKSEGHTTREKRTDAHSSGEMNGAVPGSGVGAGRGVVAAGENSAPTPASSRYTLSSATSCG